MYIINKCVIYDNGSLLWEKGGHVLDKIFTMWLITVSSLLKTGVKIGTFIDWNTVLSYQIGLNFEFHKNAVKVRFYVFRYMREYDITNWIEWRWLIVKQKAVDNPLYFIHDLYSWV